MKARRRSAGPGFTLIEMAIVLVIIGVVLVSVLQGREMIANAEYKSFKRTLIDHAEAFHAFRERYNALPGDFADAAARLGSENPLAGNAGNGLIDHGPACAGSNDESCLAWQHLRAASLIKGDPGEPGTAARPAHPFDGRISGFFTGDQGNGAFGHKLLVESLPRRIARQLDHEVDDGVCDSGRISALDAGASCDGGEWEADGEADLVYAL